MKLDYPAQTFKRNTREPMPDTLEADGRTVRTTRLVSWLVAGARAAFAQPTLWMGVIAACVALLVLFKSMPLLRPLVVLAAPLVAGTLIYAQDRLHKGEPATMREIIEAVRAKSNSLFAIGLMSGAIVAIGYVVVIATMNLSLLAAIMTTGVRTISISYGGDEGMRGLIESLISVPILVIAIASAWFAPALAMLHDVAPLEAMMASLNGAARNWGASAVVLFTLTGATLLAPAVPMLASALAITPLLLLTIYGAYRDVFVKA